MNAKLCKVLRRQATRMTVRLHKKDPEKNELILRQLLFREVQSNARKRKWKPKEIIVANNPKSTRGIYRKLKRMIRYAPADTRASVRSLG